MIGNDPQYQAWMQTVRQQNAAYDQQIQRAQDALSYISAPQSPATYGYGPMANALMQRANNTSTAMLSPTNSYNFMLMNYLLQQSQPGMGGTTLAPSAQDAQSPELIAQLLRQTGV